MFLPLLQDGRDFGKQDHTPCGGSLAPSPLVSAAIRGVISDGENKLPSALPHPGNGEMTYRLRKLGKGTKPSKRNTNNLHVKYRRQPWH